MYCCHYTTLKPRLLIGRNWCGSLIDWWSEDCHSAIGNPPSALCYPESIIQPINVCVIPYLHGNLFSIFKLPSFHGPLQSVWDAHIKKACMVEYKGSVEKYPVSNHGPVGFRPRISQAAPETWPHSSRYLKIHWKYCICKRKNNTYGSVGLVSTRYAGITNSSPSPSSIIILIICMRR